MLVPESWLREFVPDAPSIDAIEARLQLTGTATDRVERVGVPSSADGGWNGYRVGEVLTIEQHPNADRLRLCRVDVGEAEPRQIVCGASNFEAGDHVAVVLPGATLPDGSKLGTAKLRGIESFGMMLSERELELSTDHAGIMILARDTPVGVPLADVIGELGDTVLDLEITSNRPDCLSVAGVAREVAASFDIALAHDEIEMPAATGEGDVTDIVRVDVTAPDLCPRYMALAFTGVQVGPSPAWLKARLARAGMRSVSNVVDVTNYAMLSCGQPLHAFDADRISGGVLTVRRATAGERVTTLDDVERTLSADTLVIADADGPAVIAGVMGASRVEVTADTTRLVLESAAFSGPSIMATSARLGLRSESSSRFEKGLHPELPPRGLGLAATLLVEVCGAALVPRMVDVRDDWAAPAQLTLPRTELDRILGVDIPDSDVSRILTALGFAPAPTDSGWTVNVPYWRAGDVTRTIDLVEEVGRVFGYDRVEARLPRRSSVSHGLTHAQRTRRVLEDTAVGLGLAQTITYALVAPADNERYGLGAEVAVTMAHPMSVDQAQLRQSLTGSLLRVLQRNVAAGEHDVAVFETSAVFESGGGTDAAGHAVYAQDRDVLGFAATGMLGGGRFDQSGISCNLASAVGIVEQLGRVTGVSTTIEPFAPGDAPAHLHPGRSGAVHVADQLMGWVGEIHPAVADEHDLREGGIVGEIDIDALVAARPAGAARFRPFSTLPPIRQDIALLLPDEVFARDALEVARTAGGELLEDVSLFDRYTGPGVPDGHHSLALRLVFRAPDRTLTDDEVQPVRERIVSALADRFGAVLRG